jgi:hypothetical protein
MRICGFLCCVDLCLLLSSDAGFFKVEDVTIVNRNAVRQQLDALCKYTKQAATSITLVRVYVYIILCVARF